MCYNREYISILFFSQASKELFCMVIDSSLVGTQSEPRTFRIEAEAVRRFIEATGDPAMQSGMPADYVPPTFPTTFRVPIASLNFDMLKMQLLHGEQSYTYYRPLHVGEEITCVASISEIRQREGRSGPMTFIVRQMVGTDSDQQPVFTSSSTTIVRIKQER
jgi:hypothetical protein